MNPWDIISTLEQTSGKNDKIALLTKAVVASDDFVKGANLAYDPFINFGVRKIPIKAAGAPGRGLPFVFFYTDVQKLIKRERTGNAAKVLIEVLMEQATEEQWNGWYRRILMRDFKCGCTESSINKALKANKMPLIKTYSCQLAYAVKDKPNHFCGKVYLETKYDGARLNLFADPSAASDEDKAYTLSREGKPLLNFAMLEREILAALDAFEAEYGEKVMIDGEVVSGQFYKMMKQFKRKHDTGVNDAKLVVFDIVPAHIIENGGVYKVTLKERRKRLYAFFDKFGDRLPNFIPIEHEEVDLDTPEGMKAYHVFNAEQVRMSKIDPKVEGTMTKKVNGFYSTKRTTDWMKEKPYIQVTLEVTGWEYGKEEGKNADRLGGLICEGNDLGEDIIVTVGGGYSEDEREWIAANFDTHVKGQLIEIQADCFTEHEKRPGIKSLRFPIVKAFRGFTPGQKI
jgi:DNA ligase-1